MAVRREVMAPNGYLHAASVIALADTSCGYGCLANLPEGARGFTTIELKSNFLGTARDGAI
ncbi:MAG: PaaI family thioesterase, partial [Burkholderiales bacterium]